MSALRLGTRGSRLALVQANSVADRLRARGHEVELVTIVTAGDRRAAGTPADQAAGSQEEGWFTQAIRRALERGEIDLAVHSAKDLPVEETPETAFAYPERADPRDALLTAGRTGLAGLPRGATVGTDSPRRTGFLLARRPDLHLRPLHGNVTTRVEKLERGEVDGIVLAVAGLARVDLASRIDETFDPETMPPAPAQGALAIEVLDSESAAGRVVAALDDPDVRGAVEVERAVLAAMGGGCRSPLGALARVQAVGQVDLIAGVPGAVVRRTSTWAERNQLVADVCAELRPRHIAEERR